MDAYLVYDAECRICTTGKNVVGALDRGRRIRPIPLQDSRATRLLAAVDESSRWDTFHIVSEGRAVGRGDGLLCILGILVRGRRFGLLSEVPLVRSASERLYTIFHGVRDALACGV